MLDSMRDVWYHDRPKVKPWTGRGEPRVVQPKYDGHRYTFFRSPARDVDLCVFGKLIESDLEMSHVLEWHPTYQQLLSLLPVQSSIDGEYWVPGKPASCVKTAILEQWPELTFTPFAVPYWRGEQIDSIDHARKVCEDWCRLPYITMKPYEGPEGDDALLDIWEGTEGVVLKGWNYRDWWKLKHVQTADLVCTAVKPGKGKFKGQVGSLHGSVTRGDEKVEVACVSGMDDLLRASLSANDVGRVFEVKYDYVGAGDRLRFPRFVQWRDDKRASECTWEDQFQ
jgi:hypothetical protein